MKFCSDRILGATRVKMSDSEKKSEQEHVRHFLHKTCTREVSESFTLHSCKTTAENVQKKCSARAKLLFCYLDQLLLSLFFFFFYRSRCLRRLASYDFILPEQTLKIIESFAFSPG